MALILRLITSLQHQQFQRQNSSVEVWTTTAATTPSAVKAAEERSSCRQQKRDSNSCFCTDSLFNMTSKSMSMSFLDNSIVSVNGKTMRGYLYKKANDNEGWKKRYAEINGPVLTLFKSPKRTHLVVAIGLDRVNDITIRGTVDDSHGQGVIFDIDVTGGRFFVLRTNSLESATTWVKAMEEVRDQYKLQKDVSAISPIHKHSNKTPLTEITDRSISNQNSFVTNPSSSNFLTEYQNSSSNDFFSVANPMRNQMKSSNNNSNSNSNDDGNNNYNNDPNYQGKKDNTENENNIEELNSVVESVQRSAINDENYDGSNVVKMTNSTVKSPKRKPLGEVSPLRSNVQVENVIDENLQKQSSNSTAISVLQETETVKNCASSLFSPVQSVLERAKRIEEITKNHKKNVSKFRTSNTNSNSNTKVTPKQSKSGKKRKGSSTRRTGPTTPTEITNYISENNRLGKNDNATSPIASLVLSPIFERPGDSNVINNFHARNAQTLFSPIGQKAIVTKETFDRAKLEAEMFIEFITEQRMKIEMERSALFLKRYQNEDEEMNKIASSAESSMDNFMIPVRRPRCIPYEVDMASTSTREISVISNSYSLTHTNRSVASMKLEPKESEYVLNDFLAYSESSIDRADIPFDDLYEESEKSGGSYGSIRKITYNGDVDISKRYTAIIVNGNEYKISMASVFKLFMRVVIMISFVYTSYSSINYITTRNFYREVDVSVHKNQSTETIITYVKDYGSNEVKRLVSSNSGNNFTMLTNEELVEELLKENYFSSTSSRAEQKQSDNRVVPAMDVNGSTITKPFSGLRSFINKIKRSIVRAIATPLQVVVFVLQSTLSFISPDVTARDEF